MNHGEPLFTTAGVEGAAGCGALAMAAPAAVPAAAVGAPPAAAVGAGVAGLDGAEAVGAAPASCGISMVTLLSAIGTIPNNGSGSVAFRWKYPAILGGGGSCCCCFSIASAAVITLS